MNPQPKMNGWTKWLVATLWGVLVTVILFMGNVVKGNDEKTTKEFTVIRKETGQLCEKTNERVDKKLEKIQENVASNTIQLTKILEAVKYIKEELKKEE